MSELAKLVQRNIDTKLTLNVKSAMNIESFTVHFSGMPAQPQMFYVWAPVANTGTNYLDESEHHFNV